MERSKNFLILLSIIFFSICFFLSGCSQKSGEAIAENKQPVIRPAKVIQLKSANGHSARTFPGTAKAIQDTRLSFRVGGPLVSLNVEEGQYIEQNKIIAEIDPRDFNVRINTLKARLELSRAQLSESRLQYNRYRELIKDNAVAKAAYDQMKAAYEMAEAQVRADTENLRNARNALEDTVLYAPFSGYADKKFVENHQIAAAGQAIISIIDLSSVEVDIALPEDMLPDAGFFKSYTCRFNALPEKTFKAEFKEIGKQPNASNRTYPLTLTIFDDKETLIRPGMAAEVTITIEKNSSAHFFSVPVSAVGNDAERQTFIWLVDPDTGALTKQNVQLHGFASDGKVSISGELSNGGWIVAAGVNTLSEDRKVRPMESPKESNVGNEL